jgi:phosphoglycolate phosphatase
LFSPGRAASFFGREALNFRVCETEEMLDPQTALIFDLDGTITDSKPGILACLREVLDARSMGDQGPLERFVGPPVDEWTAELLPRGSEDDRAALARDYRACYDRKGWSNNSVYPGIREMLAELRRQGFPLYVCTSKQQHFAVRILDMFQLSSVFTSIYGDRANYQSHAKADLLAILLREQNLAPQAAWMVGDRIFDIRAAHANGVPCIAAGWGYGPTEECAQADAVAAAPADVIKLVQVHQPTQLGLAPRLSYEPKGKQVQT